jgi:hypothetical protein
MSGAAGLPAGHGGEEVNALPRGTPPGGVHRGWPRTPLHALTCADGTDGDQPGNFQASRGRQAAGP